MNCTVCGELVDETESHVEIHFLIGQLGGAGETEDELEVTDCTVLSVMHLDCAGSVRAGQENAEQGRG